MIDDDGYPLARASRIFEAGRRLREQWSADERGPFVLLLTTALIVVVDSQRRSHRRSDIKIGEAPVRQVDNIVTSPVQAMVTDARHSAAAGLPVNGAAG